MARASTKSLAASALAIAWVAGACAAATPDTILVNGKIFTAHRAQPWAQALAIRGERIVAVGSAADVTAQVGEAGRRLDLGGRTVIPGLIAAAVPVEAIDAQGVRALAAAAFARGVTSIQAFSIAPIRNTAAAFTEAAPALRVRLFRRPVPDSNGDHRDSRPYFPPQPSPRLDVRGMAFDFGPADLPRLDRVVGWAYGSEDPLSIRCQSPVVFEAYLDAIERVGVAEVWREKRPRVEGPIVVPADALPRMARYGVVAVQAAGAEATLRSLIDGGVRTALAAGSGSPFEAVRWASEQAPAGERVSRETAIELMANGAAYAEFGDGTKGSLTVGALADLAVLSDDVFTAGADTLSTIHSVLTVLGGQPVHDTGLWRR